MKYFASLLVALPAAAIAQPQVANPSFEADRFSTAPGYARVNGGAITGWEIEGQGVGINPLANGGAPFLDNGRVPDGQQVALLQNAAMLRQEVPGFEQGKTYVLSFSVNARVHRQSVEWPRLKAMLGGQEVFPESDIIAAGRAQEMDASYRRVESVPFTAPSSGAFPLVFQTTREDGVTVLLDDVAITEISGAAVPAAATVTPASGGPTVINGGFEADAFTAAPGYAKDNGGTITGWQVTGPGVGINPLADGGAPFLDNGAIPQGTRVAVMQNPCALTQRVEGFRAGVSYRVHLRANGRQTRQTEDFGRIRVTLGEELIVSPVEVRAVADKGNDAAPYHRVVSDPFVPATDGAYDLVIQTLDGGGVTVLIDDVSITADQ